VAIATKLSINPEIEKMKHNPKTVTTAIKLYFEVEGFITQFTKIDPTIGVLMFQIRQFGIGYTNTFL
jgi:hypothetical protein